MNILVTLQKGDIREIHFPEDAVRALERMGNVSFNDSDKPFTEEGLANVIKDFDICVTHWSSPQFSEKVLANAGKLKMIAHAAGSVAQLVTDQVYERGIKVCSSNSIMAKYVAEGVLAYILAELRLIPGHDRAMKAGIWDRKVVESRSLIGAKIGLVGFGTVGAYLMEMLAPFNTVIKIFDPYLPEKALEKYPNASLCPLSEVLEWGDIVSVHASQTPETWHLLDREKLGVIKDNALLINTARGSIIDESALVAELRSDRLRAVLDVYEEEPLNLDSPLRKLDNVILMPHMAGATAKEMMTFEMIAEIERFIDGKPLKLEIPIEKYRLMTR